MSKKQKNEEANAASTPQPTETKESLQDVMIRLGLMAVPTDTDEDVSDLAAQKLSELMAVVKNSGVVIAHTLQVFESMADRGVYPEEYTKGSANFKGREGLKHFKVVLQQILPYFENKK